LTEFFKLTPRERVQRARIKLLREKPFFGYALMHVHIISTKDLKPRGPKIVYSEDFVEQLDDEELQAVLCHELLHYLLGHTKRAKVLREKVADDQYYRRMNIAQDIVVNSILYKNGFKLPRTKLIVNGSEIRVRQGGILPVVEGGELVVRIVDADRKVYEIRKPDEKSSEEVYWEIREFSVRGGDEGHDETMYFSDDDNEMGNTTSKSTVVKAKDVASGIKTPEELMSEAYTYAKMHGNTPAGFERIVKEALKPKVRWDVALRQYISKLIPFDYTYLKPSKQSPPNIVLPGVEMCEFLEGIVAVDASGSISDEELSQFMTEIDWLARNYAINLTLISFDVEIQSMQKIRNAFELKKFKPRGGGGTDSGALQAPPGIPPRLRAGR